MLEQLSQAESIRVNIFLPIKSMILFALVAALSSVAFAQTTSSTDTGADVTTMVAAAKAEPAVVDPANTNPFSSVKIAPKPVGAGSDNQGYVMGRGYFFSVHRSNGDPAVISSSLGGVITAVDDFDFGWKTGYKVEIGWNWSGGLGLRASYFYTNQAAQENRNGTVAAPLFVSPRPLNVTFTGAAAPGTLARFRERLQIQAIDVEGTFKWKNPNWTVLISGGIRVAPTRQTYTAEDTFVGSPENVRYVQERTGYGPTGAIDFRHRLGGSNIWWTGQARIAGLWGTLDETSTFASGGIIFNTAARSNSRTTWVVELETGIEWSHKFNGGANEFFINGSFVYHNWNDLVNIIPVAPVGGSATAALDNPLVAATRTGSVSFIGGVFSAGFRF